MTSTPPSKLPKNELQPWEERLIDEYVDSLERLQSLRVPSTASPAQAKLIEQQRPVMEKYVSILEQRMAHLWS